MPVDGWNGIDGRESVCARARKREMTNIPI